MRLLWTLIRVVIAISALVVISVTVFFISSPSGTAIDTTGAITDAIAVLVLIVAIWSLWRDRARLV